MREKAPAIKLWMDKNQIKGDMKQQIMDCVKNKMQKGCAFDENQPLLHLSKELTKKEIKPPYLLHPTYKEKCTINVYKSQNWVPLFEKAINKGEALLLKPSWDSLLKSICDALRPRYGNENSFIIREGEPLDEMLLLNRGIICTYTTDQKNQTGCLKPGDFFGAELLDWLLESLSSSHPSNLRFSKMNLKCLTQVEAFSLKARDLKNIESRHRMKIAKLRVLFNADIPKAEKEQLVRTTVSFLQEMRRSRWSFLRKISAPI
ncbi:Cyclic nucleotide-gated ion channel 1 [Morella rubra]|nr:Cyclic nucleotide-gated ion channel 1 [Morella rubra]